MSCDLSCLCRMQLTCAFEPRCCRRFEHGRKRGSTTNRPRTSPTRRTGWKSASTGFAYTPHAPTGLPLFIIWAPPPPKKACYFSDSLLHCGGLWNKTAVGKSWNECLIIKTLSITSTPTLHSVSHQGGCWRGGGHHAVTSAAAFPGQARLLMNAFVPLDVILIEEKHHRSREKDEPASKSTVASWKHPSALLEMGSFELVCLFLFNHLCLALSVQRRLRHFERNLHFHQIRVTGNCHFDSQNKWCANHNFAPVLTRGAFRFYWFNCFSHHEASLCFALWTKSLDLKPQKRPI